MKKYLLSIVALLAVLLSGCGKGSGYCREWTSFAHDFASGVVEPVAKPYVLEIKKNGKYTITAGDVENGTWSKIDDNTILLQSEIDGETYDEYGYFRDNYLVVVSGGEFLDYYSVDGSYPKDVQLDRSIYSKYESFSEYVDEVEYDCLDNFISKPESFVRDASDFLGYQKIKGADADEVEITSNGVDTNIAIDFEYGPNLSFDFKYEDIDLGEYKFMDMYKSLAERFGEPEALECDSSSVDEAYLEQHFLDEKESKYWYISWDVPATPERFGAHISISYLGEDSVFQMSHLSFTVSVFLLY